MSVTVIAHFRNEEILLPWWLKHHLLMFDHGILIDHNSTDRSRQICAEFAPNWEVRQSKLRKFDAIDTDFEVMSVEASIAGWKVALNISEFMVAADLRGRLEAAESSGKMAIRSKGVIMVDRQKGIDLSPDLPLVEQKYFGYLEEGWRLSYAAGKHTRKTFRQRLLHRYSQGAYQPGRHATFRHVDEQATDIFTLWYGYSPWVDWYKLRKTSFGSQVSLEDQKAGRGLQHLRDVAALDNVHRKLSRISYDLRAKLAEAVNPAGLPDAAGTSLPSVSL